MPYKIRILPRWIIFLLDLWVVAFCMFLTLSLTYNFHFQIILSGLKLKLAIALVINSTLFYIFKSYAGIIRYTNIEDTFRLVIINLISAIFYFGIGLLIARDKSHPLFPLRVVTINFFIINFVTISYRLFVRYAFKLSLLQKQVDRYRIKAAVYNTSEHGLHTKKVMNDLPDGTVQVVAFIDDSISRGHKLMESLPIYNTDEASLARLRDEGVELIIIADNKSITKEKLNMLVDASLKYGMRVQQVPPMQDWLNGKLDTQQLRDIKIEDLLERKVIQIYNEKLYTAFKGKKILVTGAAGSIGSELVRQLVGYKPSLIIMCDKAESPLHELNLELQEKFNATNVKPYIGDICDKSRMEHLFEIYSPQIVFHAAAYKHVPLMEDHPSVAILNNVLGTKIIAELSVANDVEEFVMVSTDKAVNPTNVMGASKRIAEIFTQSFYKHLRGDGEIVNKSVTKFITTRFGNVLGSNGSVIPRFKQQLEQGGPLTVTHPEITRYFMTIPEACRLVIEAGVMGCGGEIFVFDMGEPVKIADLARKMIMLSGKVPDVDISITFTGLRPGEKLYEELLNNAEDTMPTYHDKILIAQTREYNFYVINEKINKLIACAQQHYTLETVGIMKDIVPEFISNNTAYEKVKAFSV